MAALRLPYVRENQSAFLGSLARPLRYPFRVPRMTRLGAKPRPLFITRTTKTILVLSAAHFANTAAGHGLADGNPDLIEAHSDCTAHVASRSTRAGRGSIRPRSRARSVPRAAGRDDSRPGLQDRRRPHQRLDWAAAADGFARSQGGRRLSTQAGRTGSTLIPQAAPSRLGW